MISVIIPCRNEEGSIKSVIEEMPAGIGEVIVVDNNSTDRTMEIARAAGAIVISELKIGYGAAIKRGFHAAKGDIIVVVDGDGQHPTDRIYELVDYLDKNNLDFVSGSRLSATNYARTAGNRFLTFIANTLFGLKLKDLLSGMWVFKRSVLEKIHPRSDGFELSAEIKVRAATHPEIKFAEYPIICRPRRIGRSKLSLFKDGLGYLLCLFKLFLSKK